MSKTIGILTGGGDCPGLNPAIRGCVYRGLDFGYKFIGLTEGWRGFVEGTTMPLGLEDVQDIINKGGTILGSSRTNPFKKEGAVEKCLATFKKLKLDALVACGGEDTLGVATKFYEQHKLNVVGVPKTMDNDLGSTDFTFGFDTASTLSMEAGERLIDTGRSHRRIMVLEVMGRHAGWVALYTSIAANADWVLLPEEKVTEKTLQDMTKHLKAVHARKKTALVVVSEGVELPGGGDKSEELDQFGHMLLKNRAIAGSLEKYIEKETGIETRSATIGHMQRGGPPTLFDRMLATRVGVKAAELIEEGKFGHMAALKGTEVVGIPLKEATKELRTVTPDWIKLARVFFK